MPAVCLASSGFTIDAGALAGAAVGAFFGGLAAVVIGWRLQQSLGWRRSCIDAFTQLVFLEQSIREQAMRAESTLSEAVRAEMAGETDRASIWERANLAARNFSGSVMRYCRRLAYALVLFDRANEIEARLTAIQDSIPVPGEAPGDLEGFAAWRTRNERRFSDDFDKGLASCMRDVYATLLGDIAKRKQGLVERGMKLVQGIGDKLDEVYMKRIGKVAFKQDDTSSTTSGNRTG